MQDEIAETIVTTLRATWFADLDQPVPKRYTDSVRAYSLYLQGRYAWNKRTQEGVTEGIEYFEQAIAEDPEYALAYTGLADSYALQIDYRNVAVKSGFERAKEYALKALALDDSLAEAHASLAWAMFIYDWDWTGSSTRVPSLDRARRAIRNRSPVVCVSPCVAAEARRSAGHCAHIAGARSCIGVDQARARLRLRLRAALRPGTVSSHPSDRDESDCRRELSGARTHVDDERAARRSGARAQGSNRTSRRGHVYAGHAGLMRWRAPASGNTRRHLRAELEKKLTHDYVSPVELATLYIGLGDNQRALDWVERAYDERRGWMAYLNVHPIVDPLRGDPRFQSLVKKMGL
jgi:serine/threonine-protein kinase